MSIIAVNKVVKMASQQIAALENISQSLNSYTLPEQYTNENININSTINSISIINEYKNARENYRSNRMQTRFTEYMSNCNDNDFNLPPEDIVSSNMGIKLEIESVELINQISRSSRITAEKVNNLLSTAAVIDERREELGKVLKDSKIKIEKEKIDDDDDDDVMDDNDDDREYMTLHHNEALTNLIHRESELEAKLKRLENDDEQAKVKTIEKKSTLKEMIHLKAGSKQTDDDMLASILNDDDDNRNNSSPRSILDNHEKSLESVQNKSLEFEHKKEQSTKMDNFYNQVRTLTNRSSCHNLLYTQEPQLLDDDEQSNKEVEITTPSKKNMNENLILHFQLFDKYDLQITLTPNELRNTPSSKRKSIGGGFDNLIISHAEITNVTEIADTIHGTISCPIEIDELVMLSRNIPVKKEQIRFLVREIGIRIQSTELRINDLAKLRTKYLTKVVSDQADEIICTLNEGLTIILHILLHRPVISVFIKEILGIGGWDTNVLENIKDTVNSKNYDSSVAVMDAVVKEVAMVDSEKKARSSPCNFRIRKKSQS